MALERGLEGRDQLLKLVKRHAREIQELHWTGLQLSEPYTCHGSCLLSLYGEVRGASKQKESGINSSDGRLIGGDQHIEPIVDTAFGQFVANAERRARH